MLKTGLVVAGAVLVLLLIKRKINSMRNMSFSLKTLHSNRKWIYYNSVGMNSVLLMNIPPDRRGLLHEKDALFNTLMLQEDIAKGQRVEGLTVEAFNNGDWYFVAKGLKSLVVDMGKDVEMGGFSYAPVWEEDQTGTIFHYNFYVSQDGENWKKCIDNGEFSNIMHNPVPYFVRFDKKQTAIGELGILLK